MKSNDVKKKLLEILEETGNIMYACKKTGIHRSTFYRWYEQDPFRKKVDRAIEMGRRNIADIGELSLITLVKRLHFPAVKFALEHNDLRYMPKRTVYVEPPKEHKEHDPYGECETCGNKPLPPERQEEILRVYRNFGLIK